MTSLRIALIFLISSLFSITHAQKQELNILFPDILVSSVNNPISVEFAQIHDSLKNTVTIRVNNEQQEISWQDGTATFHTAFHQDDILEVFIGQDKIYTQGVSAIPLWFSILPPLIAILMALLTKEVFSSLFLGLLVGTTIIFRYKGFSIFISFFKGLFAVVDTYAINALNNPDHLAIIVFSMMIGGMVALITMNGGMKGIVSYLSRFAKNPRSGQFITWLMGLMIFFDDYANTLVVGNTMRPVTDKLNISREKLAYIVDSTSAPIASIAFITTWIGAELSYINEGINHLGLNQSAYQVFLNSLSYSFYPIFTLGFVFILIWKNKDFGPMHTTEQAARDGFTEYLDVKTNETQQLNKEIENDADIKGRWYNAFIPVMVVVFGTIAGLAYTGWDQSVWNDTNTALGTKLSIIIGNADSFKALLWSSLGGVLSALALSLAQKVMNLRSAMEELVNGFKTMFNAVLILVLAWSIALITQHLHTATFVTEILRYINMSPYWVPALAFIFSAFIAFSTGSSWGTMAIIYPLILPACWKITMDYGFSTDQALPLFYNVVSTVLAGSVLGDHCSPISDTTILSSLASSCNHLSHVRTQMPYAILVGAVSLCVGTIPGAFGVPVWLLFIAGFGLLYLFVIKFGKKVI
jgi:Na+/H+ antiporter NhaC